MKDRYLYRAKRKDNGEWVEGYLFDDGFENGRMFVGGLVIEEYKGTACDDWSITGIDFYEVDPSTICQCTGLKDKNGKLIFESDIVRHYNNPSKPEQYAIGVIYWNEDNVRYERTSEYEHAKISILYDCVYEVIGNVFDNPELLEVGE